MVHRIVFDTDPGIDDAMAILLALRSPALEVVAVTTVFGNANTEQATLNALRLLELAGATEADRERIRRAVEASDSVVEVVEMLTLHLGPKEILVNLAVNFRDGLDTDGVEAAVDEIETAIREAVPAARRIFIEAESLVNRGPAGA